MEPISEVPAEAPGPVAARPEPRQRWRVRFRRRPDAPALPQREQLAAWEAALAASGLPLAGLDLPVPRPRLVFAAPLGVGMAAEGELFDLFLTDRRAVAEVRPIIAASMPAGHELVDVFDVWLGEPPLSGRVVAADYRLELAATLDPPARADARERMRPPPRGADAAPDARQGRPTRRLRPPPARDVDRGARGRPGCGRRSPHPDAIRSRTGCGQTRGGARGDFRVDRHAARRAFDRPGAPHPPGEGLGTSAYAADPSQLTPRRQARSSG